MPERFRAEDITDTVLGSVGIALCDGAGSGGVPHSITFTVDGRLLHHHDRSSGGAGHGAEAGSTAANLSYSLEQHLLVCDLSQMSCGWRVHDASAPLSTCRTHALHRCRSHALHWAECF